MNARKAKVFRKMANQLVAGKNLPIVNYVEPGQNIKKIGDQYFRLPVTRLVAAESWRGQYLALKRMYQRST